MSPRKKFSEVTERIGVIYARYSSHNQKEESIEQQVEECMAFAALNHIKIIQVYSDKALSGKTDKRPHFLSAKAPRLYICTQWIIAYVFVIS